MADKQRTVLVVDDDIDYLTQMRIQLEAEHFGVLTAENIEEAQATVGRQQPDVAVVDLMMDNMDDGFVFCHMLKKKYPNIPVIMVTAVTSETGMEFDTADHDWLKADVLLAKPVRFEQVKKEIKRLLGDPLE